MGMFTAFNINASGMTAERYRMDVISENVANARTTRTADGTPYRRKVVSFAEKGSQAGDRASFNHAAGQSSFGHVLEQASLTFQHSHNHGSGGGYLGNGVKVAGLYQDYTTEMNMVYDPSHPDADENGYVTYPNVSIITEMTNMIDASRAFEANSTAFNASKSMTQKGLDLIG